jgi:hypothetical protein
MLSYYGNQNDCMALHEVTLKKFEKIYKELAHGKNTRTVASTIIPLTDSNGCTLRTREKSLPLYDAVIFYEIIPEDNRQLNKETGKVETPAKKEEEPMRL